ncbi:hypothetical protein EVAR_12674_1 [Eumeta japonica]|uniref:Uncharacterized protein n=1 Tax=Eumeta variegata TaxID=151549 RepID=A0A4C1YYX5_EUMVA|nr:hypothetical protein EVAR_12674_1 [Eumeta japonica]
MEQRREVAASAVSFRLGSESTDGPLPSPSPHYPSIRYPIPTQETGSALVTPMGLRMSMSGDDYLLSARMSAMKSVKGTAGYNREANPTQPGLASRGLTL